MDALLDPCCVSTSIQCMHVWGEMCLGKFGQLSEMCALHACRGHCDPQHDLTDYACFDQIRPENSGAWFTCLKTFDFAGLKGRMGCGIQSSTCSMYIITIDGYS